MFFFIFVGISSDFSVKEKKTEKGLVILGTGRKKEETIISIWNNIEL